VRHQGGWWWGRGRRWAVSDNVLLAAGWLLHV
jgi:hypothetical protein